jgi:hypothetical protein
LEAGLQPDADGPRGAIVRILPTFVSGGRIVDEPTATCRRRRDDAEPGVQPAVIVPSRRNAAGNSAWFSLWMCTWVSVLDGRETTVEGLKAGVAVVPNGESAGDLP